MHTSVWVGERLEYTDIDVVIFDLWYLHTWVKCWVIRKDTSIQLLPVVMIVEDRPVILGCKGIWL